MKCGSNRWWRDGETRLSILRERGPLELVEGVGLLLGSLLAVLYTLRSGNAFLEFVVIATVCVIAGLHRLFARWQVVLDRESGTLKRTMGLVVPFLRREYALRDFNSVMLNTIEDPRRKGLTSKMCSVILSRPGDSLVLADSDDRQEALALAEAVSRHLRLPLGVDGGYARSADERLSAAPLPDAPLVAPPGSRIQVERHEHGLQLELPAPGWTRAAMAKAALALLVAVVLPIVPPGVWVWKFGLHSDPVALVQLCVVGLPVAGFGVFLLWRVAARATTRWRVTASSKGLELIRHGRWVRTRTERIPATRLKDIDVRMRAEDRARYVGTMPTRSRAWPGSLAVAIEHDGGVTEVGADLSLQDLEWAEKLLRRAVATRRDSAAA